MPKDIHPSTSVTKNTISNPFSAYVTLPHGQWIGRPSSSQVSLARVSMCSEKQLLEMLWKAADLNDEALRPLRVLCAAWNKCQLRRPGWEECKLRHWQIPVDLFVQQVLSRVKVHLLCHTQLRIPASKAMHALRATLQNAAQCFPQTVEHYDRFAGTATVADYSMEMKDDVVTKSASIGYYNEGDEDACDAIAVAINFAQPCKIVWLAYFMEPKVQLPYRHIYGQPRSKHEIQQRWDAYHALTVASMELVHLAYLMRTYATSDVLARLAMLNLERRLQLIVEAEHGLQLRVRTRRNVVRDYVVVEGVRVQSVRNDTLAFLVSNGTHEVLLLLVDTHPLHIEAFLTHDLPLWGRHHEDLEHAASVYDANLLWNVLIEDSWEILIATTDRMVDQLCEQCCDHAQDMLVALRMMLSVADLA